MNTVIAIAPHPDDETYGCGGALLRHRDLGDTVHWLIMTSMSNELGYSDEKINQRKHEIKKVSEAYGFHAVHELHFPPARLDHIPMQDLVVAMSEIFHAIKPTIVYLPFRGDVHTDHRVVFDSVSACTKWFRFPTIKKVLAYEALSETGFNINPHIHAFNPNSYINIDKFLQKKIDIAHIYESECAPFPFPRSEKAILALSHFRGSLAGFHAAEAFMLLREICD